MDVVAASVLVIALLGGWFSADPPGKAAEPVEAIGSLPPGVPEYRLMDMVVAQVDSTVVTLSELVAETRLVLLRTAGLEVARAANISQGLLNAVLKSIVTRELLLGEVRRLKVHEVRDKDVEQEIQAIKSRFPSQVDYVRFLEKAGFREPGATEMGNFDAPPSLVSMVLAEISVQRFLEARAPRNRSVDENEVKRCYEANKERLGPWSPTVQSRISERLFEQEQERALKTLVDQLEKKATVRYADKFEPSKSGEPASDVVLTCPEPIKVQSARPGR
jgi:hypothetical protein